jgi:hypothetical protein
MPTKRIPKKSSCKPFLEPDGSLVGKCYSLKTWLKNERPTHPQFAELLDGLDDVIKHGQAAQEIFDFVVHVLFRGERRRPKPLFVECKKCHEH